MKRIIRLSESDLHRVIEESVKRILKESTYDGFRVYPHLKGDEGPVTVLANFINYTFCFNKKKIGTFDTIDEAVEFINGLPNNRDFVLDLVEDAYSEMESGDETSIDRIIFNGYLTQSDGSLYAIGNGLSVNPFSYMD